jgi:hypothetical protein
LVRRGMAAVAALSMFSVTSVHAVDPQLLVEQTLKYDVYRGDTALGKGLIQLRNAGTPGCYFYSQEAFPKSWLRWLSGDILEQSNFCVQNDAIKPVAYRYNRDGVGAGKENLSLRFDWAKHEAIDQTGQVRVLEDGMLDRLSLQLALRDWLLAERSRGGAEPTGEREVRFPDRKGIESYRFQVRAHERVETPAGSFDTVRLDRVDNPKRRAQFWLSPRHQYIVVKAEQQREDDPVLRLVLSKAP